jgi:hypothetical protein
VSSALTLVNRVGRLFREEDAAALTETFASQILDLVNEAKREILESMSWQFDQRHDGVVTTAAPITGTATSVSGTAVVLSGITTSQIVPSASTASVARIVFTADTAFGDTAFRIVSSADSGGVANLVLATSFPGTVSASTAVSIVFDEQVLPSTVRAVLSVKHQEGDIELRHLTRNLLDSVRQRPHESTSNAPTVATVGGTGESTYNSSSASNGTRGTLFTVNPVSSEKLTFDYSYYYRHPDLSASQDLVNVDPAVEDLIVRLAYARGMQSGIGNEPEVGVALETEILGNSRRPGRARELNAGLRRDALDRIVITPRRTYRSTYGFGRVPRSVTGL